MSDKFISGCPVRFSADIFGDRWTMLVLRDLLFRDFRHFGDFMEAGEGIASNILSSRLTRLERQGLIVKDIDPEKRSRKLYSLTDKGAALRPVFQSIMMWATAHDPDTGMNQEFAEALGAKQNPAI